MPRAQDAACEFLPDGTACRRCISKLAADNAKMGIVYLSWLEAAWPKKVWQELIDLLDPQPEKPDLMFRAMRIIYELATRAVCRKISMDEMFQILINGKSIEPIFPNPLKKKNIKQVIRSQDK